MNQQLLREYFPITIDLVQDFLNESEKREIRDNGATFLTGVLQRSDTKNGNGRIYPRSVLERENENYQKIISEHRALGELDHCDESVINLKNASHMVVKTWWNGNDLMGKIKILSTPNGNIAKSLIKDGVTLGISSRGLGSTRKRGDDVLVEDDFQLICFDLVQEPSTAGAFMLNEGKKVNIDVNKLYNKADRLNRIINSIIK